MKHKIIKTIVLFTMTLGMGFLKLNAQSGAALKFDGSNDNVSIGNSLSTTISGMNKITVEAWVINPANTTYYGVICGNYQTNGSGMQFLLRRDYNSYAFWIDCGSGFQVVSGGTPTLNTWQHVAGVWNGSDLKLYLNGVLVGTQTGVAGTTFTTSTNEI